MAKHGKSSRKHIFDGKIRVYEKQIVNYFKEISGIRTQNVKIATIIAYCLVHRNLTQKQLRDLTGYSMGTISSSLTSLVRFGILKKQIIPGTHEFDYILPSSMVQIIDLYRGSVLAEIFKARDFFQTLQKEINVDDLLRFRIVDMLSFLDANEDVIRLLNLRTTEEAKNRKKSPAILANERIDSDNLEMKTEKTLEIEQKIINYFLGSLQASLFLGQKITATKMIAYFVTRETFTQRQLRDVSGLSAGTISQGLQHLLHLGLIIRVSTGESSHHAYQMRSIKKALLSYLHVSTRRSTELEGLFTGIRDEMDEKYSELSSLHGYREVYSVVSQYLRIFPLSRKMLEVIENKRE